VQCLLCFYAERSSISRREADTGCSATQSAVYESGILQPQSAAAESGPTVPVSQPWSALTRNVPTVHCRRPLLQHLTVGLHLIMHQTIGLTGYIAPLTPTLVRSVRLSPIVQCIIECNRSQSQMPEFRFDSPNFLAFSGPFSVIMHARSQPYFVVGADILG